MKRFAVAELLLVGLLVTMARAQCSGPFNVTYHMSDTVSVSCTNTADGWDLTIVASADGGNNVINVTAQVTSAANLGEVAVTNSAGSGVTVIFRLEGTGGSPDNILSLDRLVRHQANSNGPVVLENLRVAGPLGPHASAPVLRMSEIGTAIGISDL